MKTLSLLLVMLMATAASAAVIEDFESYNIGDTVGTGTIVADPDNPGNKVLSLAYVDGVSQYASIPLPDGPAAGVLGMDVYDYGYTTTANAYGPRWGAGTTDGYGAAMLYHRSWLNCTHGYGMSSLGSDGNLPGRTSSWFSAKYFGGPRLVDALYVPADPTADPPVEEVAADGAWSTWTFTTSGLKVVIDNGVARNSTDYSDNGLITDAWFYSGKTAGLTDVLIDNVTFDVPEPATMSLLALGGLALIRRRRA